MFTGFSFRRKRKCLPVRGSRGIAILAILGLLTVLSFLFLFLSFQSRQFRYVTHRGLEEEEAFQVARVAANVFWSYLQEVGRTRAGCGKLFPTGGGVSPLDPERGSGVNGLVLNPADFDAGNRIQDALAALAARFPAIENLKLGSEWSVRAADPDYVSGRISLGVDLLNGKKAFRFEFPRDFRVVQSLPRVASKFTLFVRNCANAEMFNTLDKGFQDDSGNLQPFFLYNSPDLYRATKLDTWQESGWVYLGGASVTLNIDGTHPGRRESETFLFWPTLYSTDPSAELPYSCTDYLGSSKLKVRFTPIGTMRDWRSVGNLRETLMEDIPRIGKISLLRLFGDKDRKTPTRVFGNVFAEYVLYATLIYDANNDSIPDFISVDSAGTQHRAIFPLPRFTRKEYYLPQYGFPVVMTTRVPHFFLFLQGNSLTGVPPTLADVMPAYNSGALTDYLTCMTKLASDFTIASRLPAYNSIYDQMYDGSGEGGKKSIPAPAIFGTGDYPNPGTAVSLPENGPSAGVLYKGDLSKFDPALAYTKSPFFATRYASAEEFTNEGPIRIRGGVPVIDRPTVALIEGALDLPDGLRVEAPTVLVARQGITLKSVAASPASTQARLVLVSLGADIVISATTGGPAPEIKGTALIAPAGTVRWSSPVSIEGTMCVKELDPAVLGKGGKLQYDPQFDITNPSAASRGLAFVLGPNIPHVLRQE